MQIAATERTSIDRIETSDAEFFLRLFDSSGWKRFIGKSEVTDLNGAASYLQGKMLPVYRRYGFGYYIVRSLDGVSLGICGFLQKPHLDNPDFGFAFLPEHCGRGFALESARAVLAYGVATFDFEVLDAETHPDNEASIRLLNEVGFQKARVFERPGSDGESLLFRWHRA